MKFLAPEDLSQPEVDHILRRALAPDSESRGFHIDYYFRAAKGAAGDFVRFRDEQGSPGELTAKRADRGSNFDRLELSLFAERPVEGLMFLKMALGEPVGKVHKTYTRFYVTGTEISTAVVQGFGRVIVEVEGLTAAQVTAVSSHLNRALPGIQRETRSVYQMFVEPNLRPEDV